MDASKKRQEQSESRRRAAVKIWFSKRRRKTSRERHSLGEAIWALEKEWEKK